MPTTFQNVKNWALTASTETVAQAPATITVADATQLPDAPFRVVVWRSGKGSPYQDDHRKIFAVTDVTGNVLTVTAVSGDATVLPIGSAVGLHVLAQDLEDLQAAVLATEGHDHTGVYEPANANIQTHIGIVAGNPHGTTAADVGAAATVHDHDLTYAPIGEGVTNGDAHDHSGGDGAQIAYADLSGTPDLSSLHTRGHTVASALDHTDWPADLTAAELAHVHGVTSAIQTQLNAKEATVTAGLEAQYYRGDKTWQTLNQAAVAGLTTLDSPQFAALDIAGRIAGAEFVSTGNGSVYEGMFLKNTGNVIPDYSAILPQIDSTTSAFFGPSGLGTGGINFAGFTENNAALYPMAITGYHGHATPTAPALMFRAAKHNGTTGAAALAATGIVLSIRNWTAEVVKVLGNGDTSFAGFVSAPSFKIGPTAGISATVALAKLTAGGANGSLTVSGGIITAYTAPT